MEVTVSENVLVTVELCEVMDRNHSNITNIFSFGCLDYVLEWAIEGCPTLPVLLESAFEAKRNNSCSRLTLHDPRQYTPEVALVTSRAALAFSRLEGYP